MRTYINKYFKPVTIPALLFLLAGCTPIRSGCPGKPGNFLRHMEHVDLLVEAGHFDEAVMECDSLHDRMCEPEDREEMAAMAADILFEDAKDFEQALFRYMKLSVLYKESPEVERYFFRTAACYENMDDFVNAGLAYSDLVVSFQEGLYKKRAEDGAERCFNRNIPEVAAVVRDRVITWPILEMVLDDIPANIREKFTTKRGKYDLIVQTVEQYLLAEFAEEKGVAQDGNVMMELERIRDQLLANEMLKREIEPLVKVTEEEIRALYEENRENYVLPAKVRIFQIKVPDEDYALEIHEHLDSLAASGGDVLKEFRRLAREVSIEPVKKQKGDLGFLTAEDEPKLVVSEGFKLDAGEYSHVFEADGHFNIVFTSNRKEETVRTFEQVSPSIRSILKKKETHRLFKELTGELMERWRVEILYDPDTGKFAPADSTAGESG